MCTANVVEKISMEPKSKLLTFVILGAVALYRSCFTCYFVFNEQIGLKISIVFIIMNHSYNVSGKCKLFLSTEPQSVLRNSINCISNSIESSRLIQFGICAKIWTAFGLICYSVRDNKNDSHNVQIQCESQVNVICDLGTKIINSFNLPIFFK